jgi:signal peptidase I
LAVGESCWSGNTTSRESRAINLDRYARKEYAEPMLPSSSQDAAASLTISKPQQTPEKDSTDWGELVRIVTITIALVIGFRVFIANPFKVEGKSMEPTYFDKEYLVIEELSYRFQDPVRGQVVVLRPPTEPKKYFIKRIIGLPGETVELNQGVVTIYNKAYPTGWVLREDTYIDLADMTQDERDSLTMRPMTLGADEYFVLGDNRLASFDSRFFGPITREALVGRAWVRGWPIHRWGSLTQIPAYPVPLNK